jgi:hypothetical protein
MEESWDPGMVIPEGKYQGKRWCDVAWTDSRYLRLALSQGRLHLTDAQREKMDTYLKAVENIHPFDKIPPTGAAEIAQDASGPPEERELLTEQSRALSVLYRRAQAKLYSVRHRVGLDWDLLAKMDEVCREMDVGTLRLKVEQLERLARRYED